MERVEQGALEGTVTRALLAGFVAPLLDAGADTLVLGCTHYPFLSRLLREIAGPDVHIVDPAQAVARQLMRRLGLDPDGAPGPASPAGRERFLTSAPLDEATRVMSALWGRAVRVEPLVLRTLS